MSRRGLAIGIILLFIGTCLIPAIAQDVKKTLLTSQENWLYIDRGRNQLNDGTNGWNFTYGGTSYDDGYSVQQTSDGGYIITGDTVSFGAGNWDVWLLKTNSTGREEWNRTFGGSNYDRGSSVQQTDDGGYIISGATYSYGHGDFDVWLIKTDALGQEEWNKTHGGSSCDWSYSVDQTTDGGYVIAGYTDSYGAGDSDVWLLKTDSSGNEIWNSTFGGIYYDRGFSVQQTIEGGYIITGYTVSYDADPTGCDVWLIKTDANGNEEWSRTFGGTGIPNKFDFGYSVQQTSDNGYIIAGETEVYFVSAADILLIKTDSSGNEEWNRTFGGVASAQGRSVQQTIDGGYIITGCTTLDVGEDSDIWLIKTDSNGDEEWDSVYGFAENSSDWGYSVQQTSDGGYILVGATMPDGWKYDDYPQSDREEGTDVWLIKTANENHPPIANFTWTPENPYQNQQINFNASTSQDPDGTITKYEWDWDNDGVYDESHNSPTTTHSWTTPGSYPVTLCLTDDDTATATVTKTVDVRKCNLEIDIQGGIGVKAIIINNGTTDANDIPWQLQVQGGILRRINKTVDGIINIPAGKSITMETGMLIGFGAITITANVVDEKQVASGMQIIIFSLVK